MHIPLVLAVEPDEQQAEQIRSMFSRQFRAELETRARRQGVAEMISFLGHVHDVERIYEQSRSYAVMSSSEGMPIAMLDAMAAGLPVVTPDVGEIGTLVADRRNGLLYPGGDAAALARGLIELSSDDALRETLGQTARAGFLHVMLIPTSTS